MSIAIALPFNNLNVVCLHCRYHNHSNNYISSNQSDIYNTTYTWYRYTNNYNMKHTTGRFECDPDRGGQRARPQSPQVNTNTFTSLCCHRFGLPFLRTKRKTKAVLDGAVCYAIGYVFIDNLGGEQRNAHRTGKSSSRQTSQLLKR